MAERNEADALFATKRKKQQEEQAEQERREELARQKAEMEAEIRRLEEEAKRQKEQQEEARRQAEEETRRAQEEAREAAARAARIEEMAKQAQAKQQALAQQAQAQQAQAKHVQAQQAGTQAGQQTQILEKAKNNVVQLGSIKIPLLYLVIGGAVCVVVVFILFVSVLGSILSSDDGSSDGYPLTGEDVYGTHFDLTASKMVFDYNIYYPESFEEVYSDDGALFTSGSVENGDFAFVLIGGINMDNMESMAGSTDPTDFVHLFENLFFGAEGGTTFETTSDSDRTAYYSNFYMLDASQQISNMPEGVYVPSSVMVLITVNGEGYLTAVYGTMRDDYQGALEETVVRFLDHTS